MNSVELIGIVFKKNILVLNVMVQEMGGHKSKLIDGPTKFCRNHVGATVYSELRDSCMFHLNI